MVQSKKVSNKGTVGVESFQGKLRLRLPRTLGVKKRYISTGLDDTPKNRKMAYVVASEIEEDIEKEEVDFTWDKYRTHFQQPKLTAITSLQPQMKLDELWDKYVEYRLKCNSISKNTLINFNSVASHLKKLPTTSISEAVQIFDYFAQLPISPVTIKKYLTQINAACNWGVEHKYLKSNPFAGMANKIKTKKKSSEEIKPFSAQERDAIINAFAKDDQYGYYTNFVRFLFMTGCRTGEAIALKWKHISPDFRKIVFAENYTRGVRKETKTGKARTFPCNEKLQRLLRSIKPEFCDSEDLVFPSPTGTEIDNHNFTNRAWRGYKNRHGNFTGGIVTQLVDSGVVSEYRNFYNTRHTFISMALESGVSPQQIAKWVGNSPKIIMEHYAGVVSQIQVPEF